MKTTPCTFILQVILESIRKKKNKRLSLNFSTKYYFVMCCIQHHLRDAHTIKVRETKTKQNF